MAVKIHTPERLQQDRYQPRSHIYVRQVKGAVESFRRVFGSVFLILFGAIPWIQFEGHQAILLDIGSQRFHIFGLTLWPQDLTVLAWILMIAAFALFVVTTFAGRVWCGFMCPQTVFTYIFIWLEHKLEGSHNKRIKLDARPLDFDKFARKTIKHLCWLLVALLTSMTFVGYFTPIEQLVIDTLTLNTSVGTSIAIIFFTACTYGNAGWMREIMCTHICPYARFQSVMFDADTLVVAYDAKRGEKRGPRPRSMTAAQRREQGVGDCVDCNLCVQVCPTGIDIRNGLQYECINCGACVDACNGVMKKMRYPRGLIAFTSENALQGKQTPKIRPKLLGYTVVLLAMIALLVVQIVMRAPLALDIVRDRGALYRESSDGLIENVYTLHILNKSQQSHTLHISVSGIPSATIIGTKTVEVAGNMQETIAVSVAVNPYDIEQTITDIRFDVTNPDGKVKVSEITKFLYR